MHYHMNERIDGGTPVQNGMSDSRDTLADALLAVVPAFASLGWELTKYEISNLAGDTTAEFTTEDECEVSHVLSIHIYACECIRGNNQMARANARRLSLLN